jgi:hypothetical protein
MNKKYKSEAMMVTHQAMKDLFDAGIIDAVRLGEFDARCLVPEGTSPQTPLHITHHPYPNAFNLESPSSYQRPG